MFGRGDQRGTATVVVREVDIAVRRYGAGVGPASDQYNNGWTYVADVQPENGDAAFRATFRERFSNTQEFHEPSVGEQIPVTIDKHQKVEFDRRALRDMAKAKKAARKEKFAAIASAAPGSQVDAASPEAKDAEFRAIRLRVNIDRAKAAGDEAEIDRLTALLARLEAGDLSRPTRAPAPDRLDQLQKLAGLHQSGALTDAEFAAEKAKLLGTA